MTRSTSKQKPKQTTHVHFGFGDLRSYSHSFTDWVTHLTDCSRPQTPPPAHLLLVTCFLRFNCRYCLSKVCTNRHKRRSHDAIFPSSSFVRGWFATKSARFRYTRLIHLLLLLSSSYQTPSSSFIFSDALILSQLTPSSLLFLLLLQFESFVRLPPPIHPTPAPCRFCSRWSVRTVAALVRLSGQLFDDQAEENRSNNSFSLSSSIELFNGRTHRPTAPSSTDSSTGLVQCPR